MILNSPTISGSLTVTGNIITSGSITISGSIASASYASNAELLDGLDATVFTLTSSFNAQTASFTAFTASLNAFSASQNSFTASILAQTASLNAFSASILTFTGSASTRLGALESYTSSLNDKTSSFATTGSNAFIGTQTITGSVLQSGSFTSTGTLTAQTLVVQTITSSVVYSSGSNIFGNAIGNTQTFTGSVLVTGSLTISTGGNVSAPTIFGSTITCSPIGCFATSCATAFIGGTMSGTTIYGSTAVCSAVGLFSGCVGIGTCTPSSSLVVRSALPRIEISSTNYDGSYKSFFGSLTTAQGILQFGNNSDNYILAGNTSAGGKLQFRVNINDNFGYTCGLEAFTIHCDTSVCFAGPVKLAGAYASCLGLGTTSSPAKYLHIQGTNNFTQGIRFSEAAGGYPHNIYFGSPDSSAACWGLDFQVATACNISATVLSLRGNCRVGINNTSPCSALHIVDTSANATTLTIGESGEVPTIKAGGTNTDLRIEAVGGGGFLEFVTNNTVRFRTLGTGETCFACQICTPGISITSNAIGVEYLIVAGGGGGGFDVGGGGGAGGTLLGSTGLFPGTYQVGIGAGGAGSSWNASTGCNAACRGYSTYAMGLIAIGGGGGGNYSGGSGGHGASGGGGAGYGATTFGGVPMIGSGCKGGDSVSSYAGQATGAGGGGATGPGACSANGMTICAAGGAGVLTTIIGTSCSFSCGGRGAGDSWTGQINGRVNSGYGGDGAGDPNGGCSGGSGIFVIKALNTNTLSFSGGLTVTTCTNLGGFNIYAVTAGAGTMTIS